MDAIRVLRGNRERLISPIEKDKFLADGYSVINENGSVVEQGVKSNHVLRTELDAANRRIAELEAENEKLKAKAGRRGKKDDQEEDSVQSNGESGLSGE